MSLITRRTPAHKPSQEMQLRTQMAQALTKALKARHSQELSAAVELGTNPTTVNNIYHGRVHKLSTKALLEFMHRANLHVTLSITTQAEEAVC